MYVETLWSYDSDVVSDPLGEGDELLIWDMECDEHPVFRCSIRSLTFGLTLPVGCHEVCGNSVKHSTHREVSVTRMHGPSD